MVFRGDNHPDSIGIVIVHPVIVVIGRRKDAAIVGENTAKCCVDVCRNKTNHEICNRILSIFEAYIIILFSFIFDMTIFLTILLKEMAELYKI